MVRASLTSAFGPLRLAALTLAAAPVAAALASEGTTAPEGTTASAGRWTTVGGSTSGSGSSRTRPVPGPVEKAWEYRPGGVIEGEPLVWDDVVFLTSRESNRSRSLHVVDLGSGKPAAYPRSYRVRDPLQPSIWGRVAVVRVAPDMLEAVQFRGRNLAPIWRWSAGEPLAGHLVRGADVWATGDSGLTALRIGAREPRWKSPGVFRGQPLLVGGELWACGYDARDRVSIFRMNAATGEDRSGLTFGSHAGDAVDATTAFQIAHTGSELFLVLPKAMELAGSDIAGLWITPGADEGTRGVFRRMPFPVPPVVWRDAWVGFVSDADGALRLARDRVGDSRIDVLASPDHHPEFLTASAAPTLLGNVLYAGGNAVDLETRRILWRSGLTPDRRVVPARDTALLVEDGRTLVALRRRRAPEGEPMQLGRGSRNRELTVPDGSLVADDGSVTTGGFRLAPGTLSWSQVVGGTSNWAKGEVLLVEDSKQTIRYTAGPRSAVRAIERLADEERAAAWGQLALDARQTNDATLIERIHAAAWGYGADSKQLEAVTSYLERLAKTTWRVDRLRSAKLEARKDALEQPGADAFWSRVTALPKNAPPELLEALVTATLEREPDHVEAREVVRGLLPRGAEPGSDFDALEWLRFAAAARQADIEYVDGTWRSENLELITALDRPGAVAHAISLGELVCEALDETFAGGWVRRRNDDPLVVHLYESQEEYLAASSENDSLGLIAHSAGYFDAGADTSHIYVPEGTDAFEGTRETLAHELTHHWLHVRCPRLSEEQVESQSTLTHGFWIVEGFASLVDDFQFDLEGRSWETFDPACETLDLAAGLAPEELLDWEQVLTINQVEFAALGHELRASVPLQSALGMERRMTTSGMFYAQAALVSQYLFHAEKGKHRKALRNYLLAHYGGKQRDLSLKRMFGMQADELGAAAHAWARETVEGAR